MAAAAHNHDDGDDGNGMAKHGDDKIDKPFSISYEKKPDGIGNDVEQTCLAW